MQSDPRINALIREIQPIGKRLQAFVKTLEPMAEALVRSASKLEQEFSKYDYASAALSKAGWVPHYTTPFDRDSPYWESSGSMGSPNEMVAS